jgi:hypothetical protein
MAFEKNTKEFVWTKHAVSKMRFYGLSENQIKKIFRAPSRIEQGIAPGTIALMQAVGGKRKTEVWVMYQKTKSGSPRSRVGAGQKKIITAWRYPGKSPVREVPIPSEILKELKI